MIKRTRSQDTPWYCLGHQLARLIGTWCADFIKASGSMGRAQRPEDMTAPH
jgi:hypothetical protein